MVEVLHVILEVTCVLIPRICFQILFKKKFFFFEILIPNVQHVAIGISYRPPNANDFLNIFSNNL